MAKLKGIAKSAIVIEDPPTNVSASAYAIPQASDFVNYFKSTKNTVIENKQVISIEGDTIKIAENIKKPELLDSVIQYINTYIPVQFEKRSKLNYLKAFNKMYLAIQNTLANSKNNIADENLQQLKEAQALANEHIY